MKPTAKFFLFFIPVAIIASFVFHACMSVFTADNTAGMPLETISALSAMTTWSAAIMAGCGFALFVALIAIRKWIPIIVVLLYMFAQSVMAIPLAIVMKFKPEWYSATIGLGIIVSGLLMILLVHAMKFYNAKNTFRNSINPTLIVIAVIAAIAGAFAGNIANEQLDLPNLMEQQFTDMSKNIIGILAIAIIGPLAEEVVFRGAVCRSLLRKGVPTGLTVLISAMLFGLIHFNPAQIPFAFVMGIVLGYIYCRTGSLVPTIITHILNNSISVFVMAKYGEEANNMTFADMLGSQTAAWILMAVCIAVSIGLLYVLHKKAEPANVLWDKTDPDDNEFTVTPPEIPTINA
ncbi:MAG: CPBP family intramembrane metalloprotease [Bacteroidaceae bacterium]|nr:CPBP family intramembrane metalloprotease [Bacteroidaceae bacterium]